jgi:hypothetical protein
MTTSQNGYKAGDTSLIAKYTIPGTPITINLRKGDVSVVLLHFAAWFAANIEPLTQADTGGYNFRPIAGSKTVSNHGSGTAEDLRWRRHPLGAVGTFTAAQAAKIRQQLKYYNGVIRWGGDYTGRKDEMHFEINKPPAAVKAVADKIRNDSKPARVPVQQTFTVVIPQLREGDDDHKLAGYNLVARIQKLVGASPDGVWGPKTTAAIAKWMNEPASKCKVLNEHIYRNVFGAWSGK